MTSVNGRALSIPASIMATIPGREFAITLDTGYTAISMAASESRLYVLAVTGAGGLSGKIHAFDYHGTRYSDEDIDTTHATHALLYLARYDGLLVTMRKATVLNGDGQVIFTVFNTDGTVNNTYTSPGGYSFEWAAPQQFCIIPGNNDPTLYVANHRTFGNDTSIAWYNWPALDADNIWGDYGNLTDDGYGASAAGWDHDGTYFWRGYNSNSNLGDGSEAGAIEILEAYNLDLSVVSDQRVTLDLVNTSDFGEDMLDIAIWQQTQAIINADGNRIQLYGDLPADPVPAGSDFRSVQQYRHHRNLEERWDIVRLSGGDIESHVATDVRGVRFQGWTSEDLDWGTSITQQLASFSICPRHTIPDVRTGDIVFLHNGDPNEEPSAVPTLRYTVQGFWDVGNGFFQQLIVREVTDE